MRKTADLKPLFAAAALLLACGAAEAKDGPGILGLPPAMKAQFLNPAGDLETAARPGAAMVASVVNLEGIAPGRLKLTAKALADIYLGNITRWDAPEIASLNPGVSLPHEPIAVIYRSDPSDASRSFTGFLSAQSPGFKADVGVGASVIWWPVGVGGSGDDGVAALVQRTANSIGYVDAGFAAANGLPTARLIDGRNAPVRAFSAPTGPAAEAATAPQIADWSKADAPRNEAPRNPER